MDYQQIICKETGKIIKADQIFKIRDEEYSIENVVSICHNCPYASCKKESCKNCHGKIVQNSIRKINETTGKIKMEINNYKNTFEKIGKKYVQMMEADEFLDRIEIISNLNNSGNGKSPDGLRCYSYPSTYKTDCANCKQRCHDNGELTACEKASKYCQEQGIDLNKATQKEILNLKLSNDMICSEQTQTCYYL